MNEIDPKILLKHLRDTFYRTDLEGRLILVSPTLEKLIGYTVEELLGSQLADLYVEKNQRQQFLQQLDESDGQISGFQAVLQHKNGNEVRVVTSASYYYDKDGNIAGVEGITRDITTEHQAQEKLKNYQENLERLVEERTAELQKEISKGRQKAKALQEKTMMLDNILRSAQAVAIVTTDLELNITYYNPMAEKLFGYTASEVIGKSVMEMHTKENVEPERFERAIEILCRDGEFRYSLTRETNGAVCELDLTVTGIFDPEDRLNGYSLFAYDVTELKQNKENLELLKSAIEQTSETVMITDYEGIIQYVNPAFEKISGYTSEEAIGQYPSFLRSGKQDQAFFENMWATLRQGNVWSGHFINKRKDGSLFEEEATISPVKNNEGQITNFVAVKRDVTREVSLEKQLHLAQKMEVVGLMAGGVAHDLNNILAGVVNYPELILLQLPEDSELRKPIEAIQESGKRAATVVADLLTVARSAASTLEIADIHSMVQEYMHSLEHKNLEALHPNVTFQQQLAAAQRTISCSPVHVKKCLMNLMTNASEAMEGEGTIVVSSHNQYIGETTRREQIMEPGEYVVLSVQDTGPGISKNDLEHIFEPFYTRKNMGRSGTGLGLTVVWNTMEDHHGKILVVSSSTGTCFQLYFPVSNEKKTVHPTTNPAEALARKKEHILIVDDEPHLRDIASQILRRLGYTVDIVDSGEMAIEFVKKNPVDLIVMDMMMEPGLNGRQTYEEVIKLYPDQKAIIASGFSESDDVKAVLQLGASGFIKKPYSVAQLGQVVKNALSS